MLTYHLHIKLISFEHAENYKENSYVPFSTYDVIDTLYSVIIELAANTDTLIHSDNFPPN